MTLPEHVDNQDAKLSNYCLYELMLEAGQFLGLPKPFLEQGMTLMTYMGEPIQDPVSILSPECHADCRRVHLLLRYQLWVWPGIEIGYEYHVDEDETRKIILTTRSLEPKVLSVSGFFTSDEALSIIAQAHATGFDRSPVTAGEHENVNDENPEISSDRTSDSAFLRDSRLTREMSRRAARVARLPAPSFVADLQVVRYASGQYFRRHTDYFDKTERDFRRLDKSDAWIQYQVWLEWLQEQLDQIRSSLPSIYHPGGSNYPHRVDDQSLEPTSHQQTFEHMLLSKFVQSTLGQEYFSPKHDPDNWYAEWKVWIETHLEQDDTLDTFLEDHREALLPIIRSYEEEFVKATGTTLHYRGLIEDLDIVSSTRVNDVSRFFAWIRAMKIYLEHDLDNSVENSSLPKIGSEAYPTYDESFSMSLIRLLLEDREALQSWLSDDWIDWIESSQEEKRAVLALLQDIPNAFDHIHKAWIRRYFPNSMDIPSALDQPNVLSHFEPNRFVTLFLYLNDVPGGGETVFPLSQEHYQDKNTSGIQHKGMDECSRGLAVPPTRLTASLFYSQRPSQIVDPKSLRT